MVYPGAFDMYTGSRFCESLLRSRAIDNQVSYSFNDILNYPTEKLIFYV